MGAVSSSRYKGPRDPMEFIATVWLYHRFRLLEAIRIWPHCKPRATGSASG
jgi:hypothetical protein